MGDLPYFKSPWVIYTLMGSNLSLHGCKSPAKLQARAGTRNLSIRPCIHIRARSSGTTS